MRATVNTKLDFHVDLDKIMSKVDETIPRNLQAVLPRPSLVTIYKSFIKSHLDYGDIMYNQPCKESFHQKLESIHAVLTMSDAKSIFLDRNIINN